MKGISIFLFFVHLVAHRWNVDCILFQRSAKTTKGLRDKLNRKWNAMNYYRALDRENSAGPVLPSTLASQYAWLEYERGIWHFLTSLFADPKESTRMWSNRQHALEELIKEGWTIIGAYPEKPSLPRPACGGALGYGLMRVGR